MIINKRTDCELTRLTRIQFLKYSYCSVNPISQWHLKVSLPTFYSRHVPSNRIQKYSKSKLFSLYTTANHYHHYRFWYRVPTADSCGHSKIYCDDLLSTRVNVFKKIHENTYTRIIVKYLTIMSSQNITIFVSLLFKHSEILYQMV